MNWTCKRGLFLCEAEREVTRVHVDVCIMESHSWGRTLPRCWRTCLALDTARSKGRRKGAGTLCYLGIHPQNSGIIELLKEHSLSEKLLVSSFDFFYFICFFNLTWERGSYITTMSAHPQQRSGDTVTGWEEQTEDAVCPGILNKIGCLEVFNCSVDSSNFSVLNFVVVIVCLQNVASELSQLYVRICIAFFLLSC